MEQVAAFERDMLDAKDISRERLAAYRQSILERLFPPANDLKRPKGMSKAEWKIAKQQHEEAEKIRKMPHHPTPERMRQDESDEYGATIAKAGDRALLTRKFASTHLDRLYRSGKLTWLQFHAGDKYRDLYVEAGIGLRVTAKYGETNGGGEESYGMPRTMRQAYARQKLRAARDQLPKDMVGFIDRFVIHDELPRYGGRASYRSIKQIASALDAIFDWV